MTPQQKRIVLDSFRRLSPDAAGPVFYSKLFALDPSLRGLFQTDIAVQGEKFVQMLGYGIQGISDNEDWTPVFRDLGRRHSGYGVEPGHYRTVCEALIAMLEDQLGDGLGDAERSAWSAAFEEISRTMLAVETP